MSHGIPLRIATFNINGVCKRLPQLLEWLDATKPDIVALQELKAAQSAFPAEAIGAAGYQALWVGQRTWNGVAILARGRTPLLIRDRLPGGRGDDQARYVEAAVSGILVAALYAPNGNPQPGPKFDYKLAWLKRLEAHARWLIKADVPAVLAGDYNVVPTDFDIYPTRSWKDDALLQPAPRASYARLLKQGWTDSLRALHLDQPMFTFWHYMRQRWERDAGLRLDHLLLSPALAPSLRAAGVDRAARGMDGASDHAPAWIVVDQPAK